MESETMHDFGAGAVAAHRHVNGSGWVADTARVADTAYVGENAVVFENAEVSGKTWVCGNAMVSGDAVGNGNIVMSATALTERSGAEFVALRALADLVRRRCEEAVPEWAPELRAALARVDLEVDRAHR